MNKKTAHESESFPGIERMYSGERLKFIDLHLKFQQNGRFIFSYLRRRIDQDYWLIYLDKQRYDSPISALKKRTFQEESEEEKHPANIDLAIIFERGTTIDAKVWGKLEDQLTGIQLGISNHEVIQSSKERITNYLYYLNAASSNFPFTQFFQTLKQEQKEHSEVVDRGAHHLYSIFLHWVQTAKLIFPYLPATIQIPQNIFWLPTLAEFRNQLPSTQLTILLFKFISQRIFHLQNHQPIERYLGNAFPEVVQFIFKYQEEIIASLRAPSSSGVNLFNFEATDLDIKFKTDFVRLVHKDIDYLMYQETIENKTGYLFNKKLDSRFLDHLNITKGTLGYLWQELTKYSIFERLEDMVHFQNLKNLPKIHTPFTSMLNAFTVDLFYDQTKDLTKFSKAVGKLAAAQPLEELAIIENNWMQHLSGLCSTWMTPFLKFTTKDDLLIPQWNLLEVESGEEMLSKYTDWRNKYEINQAKLRSFLSNMPQTKNTVRGKILQKLNLPEDLTGNSQAKQVVAVNNKTFSIVENYRHEKMREFGMLDGKRLADDTEEIWLDELLQLEKEVSPYLQFVKKAFHGALPIRKSVVFNHERHATNGVEFDPQTTQDIQKWMRGEIMTTLKIKIKKGNAIQINAFALDASGSMEHDKMRNLFKVLVLMVMGLEDRVSFDCFHFFSNTFMEAANFSHEFTNRKLLFNILRSISKCIDGKVEYHGDGGTNMSEGIKGCVERINKFHTELKRAHPNTLFLKSLFVITDGEPSLGIIDPNILNQEIQRIRKTEDIVIKGIYIKPEEVPVEESSTNDEDYYVSQSFMEEIFGSENYVETDEFGKAVNEFVYIMSQTYKKQRKELRYKKIK